MQILCHNVVAREYSAFYKVSMVCTTIHFLAKLLSYRHVG